MPELPEVETLRRSLLPHLVGRRCTAVTVRETRLRLPVDALGLAQRLVGQRFLNVRRRSKYLLVDLEGCGGMLIHLGMSGRLTLTAPTEGYKTHDHVVWDLDDGRQLRFNDARRFGLVTVFDAALEDRLVQLAHLGAEPLDAAAFNGERLFAWCQKSQKPIKNFLMDATRLVGVGNIYACESLFAAGIHPARAAGKLSLRRCSRLVAAVHDTLTRAIEQGGTTLRDFANAQGGAGYFAVALQVYGRAGKPCRRCTRSIKRIVQAGRSTFYCPACQR